MPWHLCSICGKHFEANQSGCFKRNANNDKDSSPRTLTVVLTVFHVFNKFQNTVELQIQERSHGLLTNIKSTCLFNEPVSAGSPDINNKPTLIVACYLGWAQLSLWPGSAGQGLKVPQGSAVGLVVGMLLSSYLLTICRLLYSSTSYFAVHNRVLARFL